MSLTSAVASFAVEAPVPLDDAPLVERAKKGIFDTMGVMVGGAASELAPAAMAFLASRSVPDGCRVLGTGIRAHAETAALVNGTFGHSQDYDDTISMMPGHPSAVILSALLGDLEKDGGTFQDTLEPYIQGVEIAVKLGAGIGLGHYQRGWHATGTVGLYGAVAALARLRKLDVHITSVAMGIASSMTSGIQRNFGTMTKPFHSGWAAHNAVVAVDLASNGFSAAPDALEAKSGFFDIYGTPDSSSQVVVDTLGSPYAFNSPGITLKKYPCCYAVHRVIDGLLAIRAQREVNPRTVAEAKVIIPPGVMRPLIYSRPTTGLEGKFSMEYAIARAVVDGRFDLQAFTDASVQDPLIQELLPAVVIVEDPNYSPEDPTGMIGSAGSRGFVEVVIEFTDGSVLRETVHKPLGSPEKELSWSDLHEKFDDCCADAEIPASAITQAGSLLTEFADRTTWDEVLSALCRP